MGKETCNCHTFHAHNTLTLYSDGDVQHVDALMQVSIMHEPKVLSARLHFIGARARELHDAAVTRDDRFSRNEWRAVFREISAEWAGMTRCEQVLYAINNHTKPPGYRTQRRRMGTPTRTYHVFTQKKMKELKHSVTSSRERFVRVGNMWRESDGPVRATFTLYTPINMKKRRATG